MVSSAEAVWGENMVDFWAKFGVIWTSAGMVLGAVCSGKIGNLGIELGS